MADGSSRGDPSAPRVEEDGLELDEEECERCGRWLVEMGTALAFRVARLRAMKSSAHASIAGAMWGS